MTETSDPAAGGSASSRGAARSGGMRLRGRIGIGALIALAALIGLIVWLVVDSGGSSSKTKTKAATAAIVSAKGLKTIASALHQPIYWLGARPGTNTELTQLSDRRIYVRYLPSGAKAGDRRAFLTVGTYPMRNASTVLQQGLKAADAVPVKVAGGVALYHRGSPNSVYVAFPGSDYQIEVYAPRSALARRLVAANLASSVLSSTSASGPVAASVAQLKALSANLGRPIYWAGSQPKVTYELTRTSDGRIYVRYLPPGASVGAHALYLTVGTYQVQNAFAVTRRGATASNGTAIIHVSGGGIAAYKKKGSTHVYVAYPGSDYQIEVFDPTPGEARRLVAAESVSPVR